MGDDRIAVPIYDNQISGDVCHEQFLHVAALPLIQAASSEPA